MINNNNIFIVFVSFQFILAFILLFVSFLFAINRPDAEKNSSYETGEPVILGQTRAPFTISFYLTAVLFLLFDLEVAFIFPALITFSHLSLYGYWILVFFFALLTMGFVLELGSGCLDLTSGKTAVNKKSL